MGNTITNHRKCRNGAATTFYAPTTSNKHSMERERKGNKQGYDLRSRTLPARNRKRNDLEKVKSSAAQTLPTHKSQYSDGTTGNHPPPTPPPPNGETSRVLFLLYLIHRTWNVLTDSRSKSSHGKVSEKPSNRDSLYETESNCSLSLSELYGAGGGDDSQCCSQYSLCSCSSCYIQTTGGGAIVADNLEQNLYNSIDEEFSQDSIGGKAMSLCKR